MRIIPALSFCLIICLMSGCYAARRGAQAKKSSRPGINSAASAVVSTGKVDKVTQLIQDLRGNKDVAGLVDRFAAVGPAAFPGLIKILKEGAMAERANAVYVLARLRSYPPEAIPVIETILDEKGAPRVNIALDLLTLNPDSVKARIVLADEMKNGDSSTKIIIARTIVIKPNVTKSLPILLDALADKDAEVRVAILESLGDVGLEDKAAGALMVPAVTASLKDVSTDVCVQAIRVLGLIGSPARSTVPVLEKIKENHKRKRVREAASRALGLINAEQHRKSGEGKTSKEKLKSLL